MHASLGPSKLVLAKIIIFHWPNVDLLPPPGGQWSPYWTLAPRDSVRLFWEVAGQPLREDCVNPAALKGCLVLCLSKVILWSECLDYPQIQMLKP